MSYPGYGYSGSGGYPVNKGGYPEPGYHDYNSRKYGPEKIGGYDNRGYDRRGLPPPPPQQQPRPVISTQPRSMGTGPGLTRQREWSTGLFDCTEDMKVCFCVWCCSPFYECYIIERDFGESCTNIMCLGVTGTFLALRYRFRDRHNIHGSLMNDCLALSCVPLCATCQLIRENERALQSGEQTIGDMHKV